MGFCFSATDMCETGVYHTIQQGMSDSLQVLPHVCLIEDIVPVM